MGKLYKIKNKNGLKWGITFINPKGQRIRKMISSYKEVAENALKKIEVQIAEEKYLDIRRTEPILFENFAKRFFDAHTRLENRSIKNQEYLLNGLVRHFQGNYLHEMTMLDIKEHLSQRSKHLKPSSVNKELTMLKSMYNRANEWEVLNNYNPTRDIKKLKENNERCRWLTEDEQECLLSHCHGITRTIVLIALKTGLRWGEIINLKWQQAPISNYVDFDNSTIFIHEALTKSKKSRYVPLASSVKQVLMDFPQHSETGYIFINPETGKLYDNLDKSFKTALRKAKINDFKFHDLRHTFASQLVRNRADLYVVQKLLGHSTPKMTQRYAHLRDDQLREVIDTLEMPKSSWNGRNLADEAIVHLK